MQWISHVLQILQESSYLFLLKGFKVAYKLLTGNFIKTTGTCIYFGFDWEDE